MRKMEGYRVEYEQGRYVIKVDTTLIKNHSASKFIHDITDILAQIPRNGSSITVDATNFPYKGFLDSNDKGDWSKRRLDDLMILVSQDPQLTVLLPKAMELRYRRQARSQLIGNSEEGYRIQV
ncbi:MAG: hypothetical protein V1743_00930 [Nanoarchaeota archaeon]